MSSIPARFRPSAPFAPPLPRLALLSAAKDLPKGQERGLGGEGRFRGLSLFIPFGVFSACQVAVLLIGSSQRGDVSTARFVEMILNERIFGAVAK